MSEGSVGYATVRVVGEFGPESSAVEVRTEPIQRHPQIVEAIASTLATSGWRDVRVEEVSEDV